MKERRKVVSEVDIKTKIAVEVGKATNGSGVLRVTFKKFDGIEAVVYFLAMKSVGAIKMSDATTAILDAVMREQEWACKENCTVVFSLGEEFKLDFFIARMAKAIEKIEAVK
jgi:hypothetical protein